MSRAAVLALLSDIKARPDDDTLRLILADFLEDHGDEADRARAEIIRAQVRGDAGPDRLHSLTRKHLGRFGQAWLGPVAPWVKLSGVERGLLCVEVPMPSLRGGLSRLPGEEAWAWVDHVSLGPERANVTGHLSRSSLLGGLNIFSAGRLVGQGPDLVRELAAAPWMASVRRLDLSRQDLTGRDLTPFFESPHLNTLVHLNLGGSNLGVAGVRALGAAPWAKGLRHLWLRRAWVTDLDAAALAEAEGLSGLRELDLRDNHIGTRGALALAGSMSLGGLEALHLYGNEIGPEGVDALRGRFGRRAHLA